MTPTGRWHFHNDLRDTEYARLDQQRHPPAAEHLPTDSYRVTERLLAGSYPAYRYNEDPARLWAFLQAGVTHFVDLTEEDERSFSSSPLLSYAPLLHSLAEQHGLRVGYQRCPVRDGTAPAQRQMTQILDALDAAQQAGQVVYVHCMGGIGRTGAAIGCYLVRHGSTPEAALRFIAQRLYHTHLAERLSPEVDEQRALVLRWQRGQ